jgi:hypothetical protein
MIYVCTECDSDEFSVCNIHADCYEVSVCPFCGADADSLLEFSDEEEFYRWEEEQEDREERDE